MITNIAYLDEQEEYYELFNSRDVPTNEDRHPAVVLDKETINNNEYYLVGKLQTYHSNNSDMNSEVLNGRGMIIEGQMGRNGVLRETHEGTRNDSYFFSGEVYLIDSKNQVQNISSNPTVADRTFLKLNLLISENHLGLMNNSYIESVIKNNVVDNIEHLNIKDIQTYNNILSSNVLESIQFIDNAIYRNRDTINQLVNYEDYQRVLKEYPKCICKIKEFILENEHLIDTQNPQGYLKELNERYNVYEAYNNKFVRDLSNSNVGQFLRDNDILPEQVEKFSIGCFTDLSTSESIELFKSQITNESLLSEINISDIDFDEKILEDRLTIPITNKYDHITGFVAIDYTCEKDIPIIYSKSIDDPALRIDNNVFNLNRVDSNTLLNIIYD